MWERWGTERERMHPIWDALRIGIFTVKRLSSIQAVQNFCTFLNVIARYVTLLCFAFTLLNLVYVTETYGKCGHGLSITRTVKATASEKLTIQSSHGNGHRHAKVQGISKS